MKGVGAALPAVALLAVCACGGGVQRATVLAEPKAIARGPAAGEVAHRWAVVPGQSTFDVVGVDVMGGHHPIGFDHWKATVITGTKSKLFVEVDMTSARGESELVTRLLKVDLLDVERYPRATLEGTIEDGVVEGNATIHGVTKGLRFRGVLQREGDTYRFVARFRISRDVFGIHAKASWDGLIEDDVHIHVDARAREERVTAEAVPGD